MTVIYQTTITHIGACATMALEEANADHLPRGRPGGYRKYCFIHNHGELAGTLQPGQSCSLANSATR